MTKRHCTTCVNDKDAATFHGARCRDCSLAAKRLSDLAARQRRAGIRIPTKGATEGVCNRCKRREADGHDLSFCDGTIESVELSFPAAVTVRFIGEPETARAPYEMAPHIHQGLTTAGAVYTSAKAHRPKPESQFQIRPKARQS